MKRRKTMTPALVLLLLLTGLPACDSSSNDDGDDDEPRVSQFGERDSHNAGENCMACHLPGGSGEGSFNLAGTVFQPNLSTVNPNTTVQLHSAANGGGLEVVDLEVDGLGNFYTEASINFAGGLYASVIGDNETRFMNSPVTNGACNACHGDSVPFIFVD